MAILPIDEISNGTWIAVNDAGLTLTLLNVYQPLERVESPAAPIRMSTVADPAGATPRSRGTIIPALLHLGSVAAIAEKIGSVLNPAHFPPFRLIAVDAQSVIDARGDGNGLHVRVVPRHTEPLLFTSSGLGDHIVEGPRRALFAEYFQDGRNWPAQQEAYHRHSWPDRRDISVCMRREKARTVSYTVVEVTPGKVTMHYHPEAPDTAATMSSFTLPRTECSA